MSDTPQKLTPTGLAALLCARICHDLVSPVSALSTALEVLDDESSPDMHSDAIDLIKLSSRQAAAKLQFLRLAFGAGGSAPGVIGVDHIKDLVAGLYGDGKVDIRWDNRVDGVTKSVARLILNVSMIAAGAIPRGGQIDIKVEETDDSTMLTFDCVGPKARLAESVVKTLSGKAPEEGFDGRTIQPFYTGMIARELKGRVDGSIEGEKVIFTVFVPTIRAQNAA